MDYHLLTGKCDGNCDWCQCPPEREEPWRPMGTAPKDGTELELLMYHRNRQYAKGDEKLSWEQVVVAKWIDFNGGGWTWYGMCGEPQGWRPLPANNRIYEPCKVDHVPRDQKTR